MRKTESHGFTTWTHVTEDGRTVKFDVMSDGTSLKPEVRLECKRDRFQTMVQHFTASDLRAILPAMKEAAELLKALEEKEAALANA
jgi:hypothetical protein